MFCNTRFFTAALTRGFVLFICLIWGHLFPMFAQLNTELLGHIDYEQTVNDVWGYVANGHEYALLGTRTGTAIIDVTDPANPTELFFVPGPSSLWRDMKVWNNYAYVTNETDSGLHVFDLQYLPDSIQVWNWTGDIFMGDTVNMTSAHNVFIDENGIAYIFGSNYGVGGAIMIDVNANPINPPIVGIYNQRYVHDGFVRGDTLWTAEIYAGRFAVIDVTNKANPVIMATQNTPFAFAHNCWLSDDGNTFITTDEKSNAPITIYDVSDITDIKELAQYRSN
ncbi:MAG TPA: choice-of-anchor B family protein, partial [Chitinophagales bacterium]|nr:choice-of-anchor B family protein [Chitinophagales bacterium]